MSQVFSYQSNPIRTIDQKDGMWFAAVDVCRALDIPWRGDGTLSAIPRSWVCSIRKFRMEGFPTRDLIFINEAATYKLAFRSNKPEADAFTNWVASEVLPAICKTGKYESAPKQAALPPARPCRAKECESLMIKVMRLSHDLTALELEVGQLYGHPQCKLAREVPARLQYLIGPADRTVHNLFWACRSSLNALENALETRMLQVL